MVGSGKGAGREHATTGVVGRCQNTGGRVGTGETKLNEGRGTINFVSKYTESYLYTAAHEATVWYVRKQNAAVRNRGKTRGTTV
jgi:hypothetical protein